MIEKINKFLLASVLVTAIICGCTVKNALALGGGTGFSGIPNIINHDLEVRGDLDVTGAFTADSATFTSYINSPIVIQEAGGDTLTITLDGDDSLFTNTDGNFLMQADGDSDDYLTISTVSNIPTLYATGSYLRIGDAATTANSLDSEDDLMVTGELEVYSNLYTGAIEFAEDAGLVTAMDMPVSATPADGTVEGYSFAVDGTDILTIYSEADSAGAVDTTRVGIGRTDPEEMLHIGDGTDNPKIKISGDDASTVKNATMEITSSGWFTVVSDDHVSLSAGNNNIYLVSDTVVYDDQPFSFGTTEDFSIGYQNGVDYLQFVDGSTLGTNVRMVILPSGNIGLNTVSPDTLLELSKNSADTELTISTYHDTEATTPALTLRKADNTEASPALVDDNAVLGTLKFQGHDGSGFHTGAKIEARIDGTPSDGTDMPTELTFWTTADGSGTPTERITIKPNGMTVFSGEIAITPSGDQTIAAGTTIVTSSGIVRVAGDGGAVTCTSDPTVTNGDTDGQIIIIQGTHDTNTVTIQDEDNNAGSTLELAGGVNFALGLGDTIQLMWDSGESKWFEITRSDN